MRNRDQLSLIRKFIVILHERTRGVLQTLFATVYIQNRVAKEQSMQTPDLPYDSLFGYSGHGLNYVSWSATCPTMGRLSV